MTAPGTLDVVVAGIGLLGPGMRDWHAASAALRAPQDWRHAATVLGQPALLPPTERRRAGAVVRASVIVAEEACRHAGIEPGTAATVFAASSGEPANCHALCESLAQLPRLVSPTRFTNSVHNVAAGTWHIATHSMQASTSIAAFDASFMAGLLEAAAQCVTAGRPLLLVGADSPYPEPLSALRRVDDTFALALLLQPQGCAGLASLRIALQDAQPATALGHAGLDALRAGIPTARALPLLQAIATGSPGRIVLEGPPGLAMVVDVAPHA
jgi:hypothetical protein